MGFNLMIEGQDKLSYNKDIISTVQADLASPGDSRAKTTVSNMTLVITGKLHADSDGTNSETIKLFQWAQVPAEQQTVYRKVTVQVDTVPQRTITLDKAFIVDYNEAYSTQAGVGTFTLVVRQKADTIDAVKIEGGAAPAAAATGPQMGTGAGAGNSLLNDLVQTVGMAELNKLDPSGMAANVLANFENIAQQTGGITPGGVLNTVGRAAVMAAAAKAVQSGFGSSSQAEQALLSPGVVNDSGQNPSTETLQKAIPDETAAGAPGQTVHQSILHPELLAKRGQNPGTETLHQAIPVETAAGAPGQTVHQSVFQPGLYTMGQNPATETLQKAIPVETAAGAPGQIVQNAVVQERALKSVGRAAVMAAMNQGDSSGTAAQLASAVDPATTPTAVVNHLEETVVRTKLNQVDPSGTAAQLVNNNLNKQ